MSKPRFCPNFTTTALAFCNYICEAKILQIFAFRKRKILENTAQISQKSKSTFYKTYTSIQNNFGEQNKKPKQKRKKKKETYKYFENFFSKGNLQILLQKKK